MALDQVVLLRRERAWLREDSVGDAQLADVVEEPCEAERLQPAARQVERLADRECDLLNALRVAGGVGVARLDGGVEALDRFERTLFQELVRLEQARRPVAQLRGPQSQRSRRAAHEQREQEPENEEHAPDGEPDHPNARANDVLQAGWIRVDLVRADCARVVGALEWRVHLHELLEAEASFGRIFAFGIRRDDAGDRAVAADRFAEVAVEREAVADAARVEARPRERAVRAPDLHADDVGLAAEHSQDRLREPARRDDLVAVHHHRAEDAVDVLRERRPLFAERLAVKRAREHRAEEERGGDEQRSRRDDEQPHQGQGPHQTAVGPPDRPQSPSHIVPALRSSAARFSSLRAS